jgi:flagellar biosynthesis/type III secretory pathway protein FliH
VDAERVYAEFERVLADRGRPTESGYRLEGAGQFFEGAVPQAPRRSRAEEAVPRAVRDVFAAYYGKLRDAAERAAVYLALVKNDGRFARKEVERARQALLKALRAGSREEALAALEELKRALKALGFDVEGDSPEAVLRAVEERARPAYEEYAAARREYAAAVDALAKFSPEAALALGEMAREGGSDPVARWMALTAYEARERALREYAQHWARPLEERWNSLPQAVREAVARREEEAAGEVLRRALRSAGIIVKRDAAADPAALEGALSKVFTANGEWGDLGERVKQAVEAARKVQRGEAPTDELARAVDALLAAYGARAAERFVESDRLEDAVGEMHEAMRRYARGSGLRMGREAAERALLLGLSAVPQEHVEAYMRGGWRGRIEPYVAYWTEDEGLARRAGEAGWEVRQIKRPASFEEGVPKEWRPAYVVAPRGLDLSAVERAVTELVDGAREGLAYIRPAEWPVPEPFIWFVLRDRMPARDGDQIAAYSIDRLSIEEPLSRFGEALRARDHDGMRKAVRELYDARLNRTVWQVVYEFDRPRARDAVEYLRRRYGEPEERLWDRHDELYLTWLAFRLADEYADYLRSGAGRELKTKEEAADVISTPWLLRELTPAFMYRLVGDEEGWGEFRSAWITAVNMWFEGLAEPYQPKKPSAARRTLELFNAFVGAGLKYEELFPPPQRAESVKPEAARAEVAKPAKPEPAEAAGRAEPEAVRQSVQTVEGRGLRREAVSEKPAEAVEPAVRGLGRDAGSEAVKAAEERGLGWAEPGRPRAPIADVIPDGAADEASYLVQRFGAVLDREAAFSAHDFAIARVRERLERAAAREPEFAHILAEAAGDVLSHFGLLMASPDAARHARDALLYLFEGYRTRDGERLYARIEPAIREAVRRAEEAGIPDAEYRVKQFVLEILDVLARAGERYRRDALKGISAVERALRATALAGLSAAAAYSAYHGLYSDAVVSSVASAIALADAGQFREAVQYAQRAAKALYEAAKELFERARVAAERLAELFVEAITRVLAWVDEHKAYLFLTAAVAAGLMAASAAMGLWGLIELGRLAYAVAGAPLFAGLADAGERAAERFETLAERYERWRIDEGAVDGILKAPLNNGRPYRALLRLAESGSPPRPLAELRRALAKVEGEAERDAAVVAALVLYRALVRSAEAYRGWAELYRWARGLAEKQEFTVKAGEVRRLREAHGRLEEAAEEVRRELNGVLASYSQRRDVYERLRPLLEVDLKRAEGLAEARRGELSKFGGASMGTKAYAALLSIARGGIYGHAAMLLAGEGALADIVISTPRGAYNKASDIAGNRGEAVDPSRSPKGAAVWEDRAASALLRYLLGRAGDEDLRFRRVGEGFEVFKAYGGVETRVDELKVGEVARSKAGEEEVRRFVEEARRAAPDLSGMDKAPQYLEWRATDMTSSGGQVVAGTAHTWQAAWYIALLGEPESSGGGANVTRKGRRPNVTMYWPRGREDRILRESRWLKSVLGRPVKSWRDLVDAIDWSWILERVGELADAVKPWIGRKDAGEAEREGRARRMLGELALFAHFAEARKGMDDDRWRKERAVRLSRAVEALSGGRIRGEYAERLAGLIILYAERRKEKTRKRIENLAEELAGVLKEDAERVREEVWGLVDFALNDMHCLAEDCARDEVARKFAAPALELIMLDKAARGGFDGKEALLCFGEMYATAIAGDGTVGPREVALTVGGELGGGATLLRLATLHLLNDLLPGELKFGVHTYVGEGRYYRIAAYGEDAARLMRLLTASAPSAGGGYLSPKFDKFVGEAQVAVRPDKDSIRQTKGGLVAADLVISEAGVDVKYNVYLRNDILLQFRSTDRSRVELAARLLRLAGVDAEVGRESGKDIWYVRATTDKLAAGRKELRDVLAEIVKEALARGWVDAGRAGRWLEKLEGGRVLKEGWPKYLVRLAEGALQVRYRSTDPEGIEREAQRLRAMGLAEGRHFAVKKPKGGRDGYVSILKDGLMRAAWLSIHGSEEQRELAADFVEYILQRAKKEGDAVYKKAEEIVDRGKEVGSLRLTDVKGREVDVGGRKHVVSVLGGGAQTEGSGSGRTLLRIAITAEVDGVRGDYEMTYGRYGKDNETKGYAYIREEADAERFSALVEVLTGKRPRIRRMRDGRIRIECGREHLEGFARYTELADTIMTWLGETGRR